SVPRRSEIRKLFVSRRDGVDRARARWCRARVSLRAIAGKPGDAGSVDEGESSGEWQDAGDGAGGASAGNHASGKRGAVAGPARAHVAGANGASTRPVK